MQSLIFSQEVLFYLTAAVPGMGYCGSLRYELWRPNKYTVSAQPLNAGDARLMT